MYPQFLFEETGEPLLRSSGLRMGLNKEDYWWYRDLSLSLEKGASVSENKRVLGALRFARDSVTFSHLLSFSAEESLAQSPMLVLEWASSDSSCSALAQGTQ